jgi:hypothetical protein
MSFNKPNDGEHRSALQMIKNRKCRVQREETDFLRCKEDLITLRPGREYASLDAAIERLLQGHDSRIIRVRLPVQ